MIILFCQWSGKTSCSDVHMIGAAAGLVGRATDQGGGQAVVKPGVACALYSARSLGLGQIRVRVRVQC